MTGSPVEDMNGEAWVTLDEASRQTGVSLVTLREWYHSGALKLRRKESGRRLVELGEVRQRTTGRLRRDFDRSSLRSLLADGLGLDGPSRTGAELQSLARERSERGRRRRG